MKRFFRDFLRDLWDAACIVWPLSLCSLILALGALWFAKSLRDGRMTMYRQIFEIRK